MANWQPLFSFSVLTLDSHHLITGRLPVDAGTRHAVIEDDKPDPLAQAHEANKEVPKTVSAVLAQAMAMRRKERPASAAQMRQMLREASAEIKLPTENEESKQEASKDSSDELKTTYLPLIGTGKNEPLPTEVLPTKPPSDEELKSSNLEGRRQESERQKHNRNADANKQNGENKIVRQRKNSFPWVIGSVVVLLLILSGLAALFMFYETAKPHSEIANQYAERAEELRMQNNDEYHNGLGYVLHSQNKYLDAENEYREAIRLEPDKALYHSNLGNALYYQRRYAEAKKAYQEAVRLDPSNDEYRMWLESTP